MKLFGVLEDLKIGLVTGIEKNGINFNLDTALLSLWSTHVSQVADIQ